MMPGMPPLSHLCSSSGCCVPMRRRAATHLMCRRLRCSCRVDPAVTTHAVCGWSWMQRHRVARENARRQERAACLARDVVACPSRAEAVACVPVCGGSREEARGKGGQWRVARVAKESCGACQRGRRWVPTERCHALSPWRYLNGSWVIKTWAPTWWLLAF